MGPSKAVEAIPVLQRGIGAHHRATFGAVEVRCTEVVLGDDERLAEDARGRLHDRNHVGRIAFLQGAPLVVAGGEAEVIRVVGILVVVDDVERVAFKRLCLGIPPVAAAE